MLTFHEPILFCLLIALQVAGVLSLIVARVCEKAESATWYQGLFIGCLLAVGIATALTIRLENACWISCAATLGVMSVGANIDTGSRGEVVEY